jgi:DNA-directed RNA polymerase specialized sigma24 family protein
MQIWVLYADYGDWFSMKEIARIVGCSQSTVRRVIAEHRF